MPNDLTYMWNLKTKQKSRFTDIKNRLVVARGGNGEREVKKVKRSKDINFWQ